MNPDQRIQTLRDLADMLARRRLLAPTRMLLDVVAPLSFLASQVAVFTQPFVPRSRWRDYVAALDDKQGWVVLRHMVDQRDS